MATETEMQPSISSAEDVAVADTSPLVTSLEGVKHPLKGVIHPLEGVVHPLEGVIHPQEGVIHPIEAMHPLEGVIHPLGVKHTLERTTHPLEHSWSFWMFTNDKKKWEDNLVELTSFDTVEDYWCLYHHMKLPSELSLGQDYAIFKKGITPMWEDPGNRKGGRWLISLEKRRGDLDGMWLDTVLLLIGENFEENNDDICGVVVNVRAKCKIAIWTANAKNNTAIQAIGKKLKETLGSATSAKIAYQVHDSSKNIYTV